MFWMTRVRRINAQLKLTFTFTRNNLFKQQLDITAFISSFESTQWKPYIMFKFLRKREYFNTNTKLYMKFTTVYKTYIRFILKLYNFLPRQTKKCKQDLHYLYLRHNDGFTFFIFLLDNVTTYYSTLLVILSLTNTVFH